VGWFVDPTPTDHSEFADLIINPFAGQASFASPIILQQDLYTVVASEMQHVLGITSDPRCRFQQDPNNYINQLLDANGNPINDWKYVTADDQGNMTARGTLWGFTGPSVNALLTSNNGGITGADTGVPTHVALPQATGSVNGFYGVYDTGTASGFAGIRLIPSN